MQINLNRSSDEAHWFAYEEDSSGETQLLIAPKTQLINETCLEKAMPNQVNVNGRFRTRGIVQPRLKYGLYQRLVFQACVKGWKGLKDETGAEIPYTEEMKAAVSEASKGLVQFVDEIADALGDMSVEEVKTQRDTFRGMAEIPPRSSEPEL
jgi:hypothetical protein